MLSWRQVPWRYPSYALAAALLVESIVLAADVGWFRTIGPESGPVEYAHLLLCASAAVLFARAGVLRQALSDTFAIAAYGATLGVVREMDALLDHVAFKGAYKVPAAVIGTLAVVRLLRSRSRIVEQLRRFSVEPSFVITAVGALVVLVYAQIIGQKGLWMVVMGADYARPVKDAAEELQELLGYILIFVGALDTYVTAPRFSAADRVRTPV